MERSGKMQITHENGIEKNATVQKLWPNQNLWQRLYPREKNQSYSKISFFLLAPALEIFSYVRLMTLVKILFIKHCTFNYPDH